MRRNKVSETMGYILQFADSEYMPTYDDMVNYFCVSRRAVQTRLDTLKRYGIMVDEGNTLFFPDLELRLKKNHKGI